MAKQSASCDLCSDSISHLIYKCNYCGSSFCSDHHLPENHSCVGLKLVKKNDEKWGLGMLDIDSEPSKNVGVKQAVEVIKDQQSPHTEEKDPSTKSDEAPHVDESSGQAKATAEPANHSDNVRDRAEEVVEALNTAPDLQQYKKNPESAYETVEPMVYSSSVDPDYESSPDVAVDGSIKSGPGDDQKRTGNRTQRKETSGYLVAIICLILALSLLTYFVYF